MDMKNEKFHEIIRKLKHELAVSQLTHLSSIIEYQHGFENTACWHEEEETYDIVIDEDYWEFSETCYMNIHEFEQEELIKNTVYSLAHDVVKKAWSEIPYM